MKWEFLMRESEHSADDCARRSTIIGVADQRDLELGGISQASLDTGWDPSLQDTPVGRKASIACNTEIS